MPPPKSNKVIFESKWSLVPNLKKFPQGSYVKSRPGLEGRTLCDRVIRACNHQLGAGSPESDHVSQLVKLMEVSLHGYDICTALVPQSSPLYMEKIIVHIVKKLSSLEAHSLCSHVAGLLYSRLTPAQQDYCVLLRSCFSILWSGLAATKDRKILAPQDKLRYQMQALNFLLLLNTEVAGSASSKAPIYTEDAITEYESGCGAVTKEDASFLLQEVRTLFSRCWTSSQGCEGDRFKQYTETSGFYVLSEMVLVIVKVLCKAGHYDLASAFLNEIESKVRNSPDCPCTPLLFGKWVVKIHSTMKAGKENGQALTVCARALKSLSEDLGDREAHAILEGCGLMLWAVESGHTKGLSGPVLLALYSFLEEHQKRILDVLKKTMCYIIVTFFHSVLTTYLVVMAVSNIACRLYNQRLYEQAFTLVEILCRNLSKNCPVSLSLSRPFMLAVQTSRRAGQMERALDWVILWLKALGDQILTHMAEPVSLWVKTKTDAARNSDEDIRLRTLRDGFGSDVPDEEVMLSLLEEELRAYKEVAGDTAQERYNTLCDLLDICHEESSHTHLRAVYLCEMAQVVCFQDFSEQTDCTAVDFTVEALRLLEEEPETPENADKLKDDKAHALLWLYICTVEKNLQEVSTVYSLVINQGFCVVGQILFPYLCEVLKEVNEQRQSKSWYLLRARALQICCLYLSLDTKNLLHFVFKIFILRILLVTLVGRGLYGTNGGSSDVRFVDQGDNLLLKWQLLSELLNCSMKMVAMRSSCGAVNDARLQCLEALKLAIKLQALSQCAELLVMKAELELMQGEREESEIDLDKVRNLLELCTGEDNFTDQVQKAGVKIRPRKGCPVQKSQSPASTLEDEFKGFLTTRLIAREPVVRDMASSPPLKARPSRWLSSLAHESDCQCPCCSEPCLGRATARWAATQADLVLQLDPNDGKVYFKLQWAALARCKRVTASLGAKLEKLFPSHGRAKGLSKPLLMQDVVGRVYLRMALSGLEPRLNKVCSIWKILEAGLAFVDSTPSPVLRSVRAGLMVTKAIVSLMTLASAKGCAPVELFSSAWTWNVPKVSKEVQKTSCSTTGKGQVKASASVQKPPRTAPRLQFHVYKELSPVQDKVQPVPAAPRLFLFNVFLQVEFSDESDSEANTQTEPKETTDVPKRRATGRRAVHSTKTAPDPPAQKVLPKRQAKSKKGTPASIRRGRTRRQLTSTDSATVEEPDKFRTIEEETNEVLDMSTEQLRTSDTETEPVPASNMCCDLVRDDLSDLRSRGHLSEGLQTLSHSNNRPGELPYDDVQSLLHSAWLGFQHFPPPTIYPTLCALLALTTGQQDPVTTAVLHAQSLGITSRHRTIRHLASCLKKLTKSSSELADKMDALSLNELNSTESRVSEQRLSQLENIFSFPTADSSSFPQSHCHSFLQQLQHLPPGVTVCMMSVLGLKPGEMGNSILLSRIEKGSAPITVHIPTCKHWLVQEIDSIKVEQKAVSCVSEKAKWWEGRRALDARVEVSGEESGEGLFQLRHPKHCYLCFFPMQYLQKLPWESISILKSRSVSRMPSLYSLIGLGVQKESILNQGVDKSKVFYVLDPDANLEDSKDRFKEWFSRLDWEGVCGVAPDSGQLEEAVATKDLYIYVGHGAGARFLDSQAVLKRQVKAASLLFGCSSAALAVCGDQEGQGIILSYLMAGCPLVLGNLWDVTDRDIDRFTKALLETWLNAGSGASLLDYMGPSRQATHLKHLIGAAPVIYGLPVHLQ
uniref:separase n=1 Tax=Monopterus albus TaxID=43700 RepID=A0A3Q3JPP6_MONAL